MEGTATIPMVELERLQAVVRDRLIVLEVPNDFSWSPGTYRYLYRGQDTEVADIAQRIEGIKIREEALAQRCILFELERKEKRSIKAGFGARLRFLFTGKR
jgi:predicted protein tyrosine phosphatase